MSRFIHIVAGTAIGAVAGCLATAALGATAAAIFYGIDGGTGKYSAGNGILYAVIFMAAGASGMFVGSVSGCIGICWKKTFRAAAVAGACGASTLFLIFLFQMCLGL